MVNKPKPKFKKGNKVKILPRGGKGIIVNLIRSPGVLEYSYEVRYKQRKNSRIRQDWFPERWIALL